MAMVLDNVTTVILVTPVIIRICELSNMKPIPVLMIIIFASNMGGIMTPIGDPPNIIIMGNQYFQKNVSKISKSEKYLDSIFFLIYSNLLYAHRV